jgi:hypothetical protein
MKSTFVDEEKYEVGGEWGIYSRGQLIERPPCLLLFDLVSLIVCSLRGGPRKWLRIKSRKRILSEDSGLRLYFVLVDIYALEWEIVAEDI